MLPIITSLYQRARKTPTAKILLPEGEDKRVLQAAERIAEEEIAQPVVIATEKTRQLCAEYDVTTDNLEFRQFAEAAEYTKEYENLRDVTPWVAREMLTDELVFGALLLQLDEVDGVVAGTVTPTAEVVAVANGLIGLEDGIEIGSSYFLMVFDDPSIGEEGTLLYADCGVNIDPSTENLADIAVSTAKTARTLLDWSPRVAMLSFSTKGSAVHKDAEQVAHAAELARDRMPNTIIDGELQADVALVEAVAEQKLPGDGLVMGDANILIFPDLNAGNIAYKLTERLGDARALGPVLQGYARPISDLSRGASTTDVVDISAIIAVQAAQETTATGNLIQRGLLARQEEQLSSN